MPWEVLNIELPRGRTAEGGMYLRVNRVATASLSKEAVEALGNPDYVTILIDRSRDLFAIRAAKPEEAGARMLRRVGSGYTRTVRFADLLHVADARKRIGAVPLEAEEEGFLVGKIEDLRNLPLAGEPTPRTPRKKRKPDALEPASHETISQEENEFTPF